MTTSTQNSWAKFLNPESLRSNLILASLFIASFETLKETIIGQIKDFYTHGWDENGPILGDSYRSEVLASDAKQNTFRASIAWLKKHGVIDDGDQQLISELTLHRNEVAHQLPKFLSDAGKEVQIARLGDILTLVTKIDRWWIVNVELAIRDDIDPEKVMPDGIVSGRMLFLRLLYGIATGAQYTQLYEEFLKLCAMREGNPDKNGSPSTSE